MGQVSQVKVYMVEYDLPADARRKRFYRRIRRYFRLHYMDPEGWSTQSVVITENRNFAWYVWREARGVGGTAHIYEGHQLDTEP